MECIRFLHGNDILFPSFCMAFIKGKCYVEPTINIGNSSSASLKVKYAYKVIGILNGKFLCSALPLFVCLFIYLIIYLGLYRFIGIYFILWIIIQY